MNQDGTNEANGSPQAYLLGEKLELVSSPSPDSSSTTATGDLCQTDPNNSSDKASEPEPEPESMKLGQSDADVDGRFTEQEPSQQQQLQQHPPPAMSTMSSTGTGCIFCSDNHRNCIFSSNSKSSCEQCEARSLPCLFTRPNPISSDSQPHRMNNNCTACQELHRKCCFDDDSAEKCKRCFDLGLECRFKISGELSLHIFISRLAHCSFD